MKKFGKMIKGILKIWFFYLIVCLAILPLYHKRADEENRECERVLNMAGQERILNIENNVDALVWRLRLIESANDLFLGNYIDSYNEDRDILVYETVPGEGNSYIQIQDYFKKVWNLSCCRMYRKHEGINGRLREHYQEVREKYPEAFCEIDWFEETIETESIQLCTNPIDPDNKQPQVWNRMVNEMEEADNILIQTPYVICNQKMYGDLKEICSRSVKTELIINAVESGANPFGCTDYLNQKKDVRQIGSYVYEYVGTQALHTKTVLAGDTLSIVGSCNLDMRSVYLDTEMMLFIECKELNETLREHTEKLKLKSRQVAPDGTIIDECESLLKR